MGSRASLHLVAVGDSGRGRHLGDSVRNAEAGPSARPRGRAIAAKSSSSAQVDATEQVALAPARRARARARGRARRPGRRRRSGRSSRRSRGCGPRATPAIIRPVGVGLRSPSPTGVVGLTTTASAAAGREHEPLGGELRPLVRDLELPRGRLVLLGRRRARERGRTSRPCCSGRAGATPARAHDVEQRCACLRRSRARCIAGSRRSCRARRRGRRRRSRRPTRSQARPRSSRSTRSSRTSAPRSRELARDVAPTKPVAPVT